MIIEYPTWPFSKPVFTVSGYAYLKLETGKVGVGLSNLSGWTVTVKSKTFIAKVSAANVILAPKVMESSNKHSSDIPKISETQDADNTAKSERPKLSSKQLETLFSKGDLSGIENWSEEEQKEVRSLITEYGFLFA